LTRPRGARCIDIIDQTRLPHELVHVRLSTPEAVAGAISGMLLRGAPLIGAAAAYGVALAADVDASDAALAAACDRLLRTRPTAVNLRWALDAMAAALAGDAPPDVERAWAAAAAICDQEVARCEAIGLHGVALIEAAARAGRERVDVLTHCNAGWLATVDWGTALAPVYKAHERGLPVHVWVDETRPRNQGLLTAWELAAHGVPHTLVADNAGGHLMQHGRVDLCIVGTDRTTRDGDVCNKIGTYLKALAARDNGVPFYVAAPSPSIDWRVRAADIPIEERAGDEVRWIAGAGGVRAQVVPAASPVANPAFDVTPRRLVTAIVTERGVAPAGELAALFPTEAAAAAAEAAR
jgi:methylthioribose-1-phosphate isomerase